MAEDEEVLSNLTAGQRAGYWMLRGVLVLLRVISVRGSARLGSAAGRVGYRCMSSRRRAVINNLRIVFGGEKTAAECEPIAREVFRRAGANLVGGFCAGQLSREKMLKVVEVRGGENLHQAVAQGRGVIVILGHMGPWEILAQMGDLLVPGQPFGGLYRPIDNPSFDALIRSERQKRGARLFSRKSGLSGPVDFLREGGVLGVLADQRTGQGGVWAPFFGRQARTTRLPYVLHRKTRAPVVAISARTAGTGRWVLQAHPPVFSGGEVVASRETFVGRCNAALEEAMRTSIEDVFWFHRRWRAEGRPFFPPVSDSGNLVQRRALVVLPGDPDAAAACARGIAAYSSAEKGVAFVLAGENPAETARKAGLPAGAENILTVAPDAEKKEILRKFDSVDRLGPVGIDGALVFAASDVKQWGKALRDAGMKIVLGAFDAHDVPGMRRGFTLPEPPESPEGYQRILDQLSAGPKGP